MTLGRSMSFSLSPPVFLPPAQHPTSPLLVFTWPVILTVSKPTNHGGRAPSRSANLHHKASLASVVWRRHKTDSSLAQWRVSTPSTTFFSTPAAHLENVRHTGIVISSIPSRNRRRSRRSSEVRRSRRPRPGSTSNCLITSSSPTSSSNPLSQRLRVALSSST